MKAFAMMLIILGALALTSAIMDLVDLLEGRK